MTVQIEMRLLGSSRTENTSYVCLSEGVISNYRIHNEVNWGMRNCPVVTWIDVVIERNPCHVAISRFGTIGLH
jgi:hypothetical protein